jgi:signal transduction histidine kinase
MAKRERMVGKEPGQRERLFELLIHDLTGPLAVISASTTRLLRHTVRNGSLTERQKSTLDRIRRNAQRSQIILQEMIEILRSEEGLFQNDSFSVGEILKESILEMLDVESWETVDELAREENIKRFCTGIERYGIFIGIAGKYAESSFSHDLRKVQQILGNLMSNALKHRRQRVDVTISGDADLLVSVRDDGRGIPEKDHKSVFERFVQLRAEENLSAPGLGLGLAGVKVLVEAMGGKIALVSREGVGTEFSVNIPPLE